MLRLGLDTRPVLHDLSRMLARHIIVTAPLIIALLWSCGDVEAPQENTALTETDDRPAIVFLGDSLTAGRGLAASESAPALIQEKIDAADLEYRVINAGRSGDTTAGGLARLPWYLRPEVNPKKVVIGLGSNDAMRGLSVSEIEANLRKIVQAIREYDASIDIFLYQMYIFPNMGPEYSDNYESAFQNVARAEDITLLPFPLENVGGVAELNQDDGIHPNVEGTQIVAENIWKALRPHL